MNDITEITKVGEIAAQYPKATEIFKKYKIDFCCGGDKTLKEASSIAGADIKTVLTKLDELVSEHGQKPEGKSDYLSYTNRELIDHIEGSHHVYMKKTLPLISELASKILRVHGQNHTVLFELHKLYNLLRTELEQHLIKEEEVLFPLIKEYEVDASEELQMKIVKTIEDLENEHETAGAVLKKIRDMTCDYNVPDDVCETYEFTYEKLMEMESDLFSHIHLENNILFKRL